MSMPAASPCCRFTRCRAIYAFFKIFACAFCRFILPPLTLLSFTRQSINARCYAQSAADITTPTDILRHTFTMIIASLTLLMLRLRLFATALLPPCRLFSYGDYLMMFLSSIDLRADAYFFFFRHVIFQRLCYLRRAITPIRRYGYYLPPPSMPLIDYHCFSLTRRCCC